jgi:hypothetical protein
MKRTLLILAVAMIALLSSCDFLSNAIDDALSGINDYKVPPTINANTIDMEITGIGTQMRAFDNFPSVTLYVKAKTLAGALITDLQEPDFFEAIEDNGSARPIYVTARGAVTSSNKKADIVFVVDTTGSMSGYLDTITAKAQDFADLLAGSDIDYKVGFVTFGDDIRKTTGSRLAPTNDISTFKTAIDTLIATGGDDGDENQIDAVDYARAAPGEASTSNPWGSFQADMGFSYRSDAAIIFILVTDIGYHTPFSPGDVTNIYSKIVKNTPAAEVAKLNATGVSCFVVGPALSTYTYPMNYEDFATATGGTYYSTSDSFSGILDTIGEDITLFGDYMITFLADDFSPSKAHSVRIALHTRVGDAQATASYTSPSTVNYSRAAKMLQADTAARKLQK